MNICSSSKLTVDSCSNAYYLNLKIVYGKNVYFLQRSFSVFCWPCSEISTVFKMYSIESYTLISCYDCEHIGLSLKICFE